MPDRPGILRFGVFEVHLAAGELRKSGARIKLQEQPFQVLAALLERPGEIVTKEELKERLWAGDTFVDFDHSLSTAVNKIREALGDSTSSPRFIQTIPKRGYRFVGVLEPRAGTAVRLDRSRVSLLVGVGLVAGLAIAAIYSFRAHRASTQPAFIETPLTALPGSEQTPSFSMDGTMVAFSCEGEQALSSDICLQVVGDNSGHPRRLTRGPARDLQPVWSPDGTSIAFVRVLASNPPPHGGRYALMEVPALGGQERTIIETSSRNDNLRPVWAPDSRYLVYSGRLDQEATRNRLLVVARDSGAVWPLTSAPSGIGDFLPTFSPDGNSVAFMRDAGYFTLRIAGSGPEGEPQPVPVPAGFQRLSNPVWAPEGGELYFFAESPEGRRGIWTTPITEATEPRFLSAAPGYAYYDLAVARGSSGGLRFAYKAEVRDGDIMRVSLTAPSTPEPLITSTKDEFSPQFSPDGSKVAYVSDRSGTKDLYYFNLQDGNHTALTKGAIQPEAYPVPMWSPDSRHILYSKGFGISIVDVQTHRTLTLAQHGRWPCWSRDGQWVYFISEKGGNNALWRVSVDASTEERLRVFPSSREILSKVVDGRSGGALRNHHSILEFLSF